MKKFLCFALAILILILSLNYLIYYQGYYLNLNPDAKIMADFKVSGKKILINQDGKYSQLAIKGVTLPSYIPKHHGSDFAIDYDTYYHYFELISEMGANTILIYTIYNDSFYDAFYDYNRKNKEPLYLLQGLQVSDYANDSSEDAYGKEFYYSLKEDGYEAIDVIHGKRIISANQDKGSGYFNKNVSPWVIGYIIGNDWNGETIAYTNHQDYETSYQGTYISTNSNANAFEVMIAKVMDSMIEYESNKYKTQRLITMASSLNCDPFEYQAYYASQMNKVASIDINNFVVEDAYLSGVFASYSIYDFYDSFYEYFSADQKTKVADILSNLDTTNFYTCYGSLLSNYHSMPVVITGYGFSSSRGSESVNGPLSETQQGMALINTYQDLINSGIDGVLIDSWQDSFDKRMWNTSYAIGVNNTYNWHDIQSESTGFGLLTYKTNENLIDGSNKDWPEKTVISDNSIKISAFYDEIGLYLYLEGQDVLTKDIYIPIDVTDKSGSNVDNERNLSFSRNADFLLKINKEQSELLVQSRYESLRANYLYQIERQDPFIEYPSIDEAKFVAIKMICENKNLVHQDYSDEQLYEMRKSPVYPTGILNQGAKDDALTDLAYGKKGIEIRIPWQMLNFYDPTNNLVHDDYYENYGVIGQEISKIYLGAGYGDKTIKMNEFKLDSDWNFEYHEHLKESYYLIKDFWSDK